MLRPEGTLVLLGLPEEKLPSFFGQALVGKNLSLAGSLIGGTDEIKCVFFCTCFHPPFTDLFLAPLREMLALAAAKNIRPWITVRPIAEASQAVKDTENGHARCTHHISSLGAATSRSLPPPADRYVLEN